MSQRPEFIDLNRSNSQTPISRSLRSPRLHVVGEVPPKLSPLDAFAMHSRMLAKQLEESQKTGRRMSRLPPLTDESPLIVQGRSDYFRSFSNDSVSDDENPADKFINLGVNPEVQSNIDERPVSVHPRLSEVPSMPDFSIPPPIRGFSRESRLASAEYENNSFGAGMRREQSPAPVDSTTQLDGKSRPSTQESAVPSSTSQNAVLAGSPKRVTTKTSSEFGLAGLLPPRAPFSQRSSSVVSSLESTDEDTGSSLNTSFHSHQPRTLSAAGSGLILSGIKPYQRSSSVCSDASGLPRPSFNFSRPLSRAGTAGLETPARQTSTDSQPSLTLEDDTVVTPVSLNDEGFLDFSNDAGAHSYLDTKFILPRGKALQRNSAHFLEGKAAHIQPEHAPSPQPNNVETYPLPGQAPPSPPTRPSSSSGSRGLAEPVFRQSLERSKLSIDSFRPAEQPFPDPSTLPSNECTRPSENAPRGRLVTTPHHDVARGRTGAPSTATSDSASTIKAPRSMRPAAPTTSDMTADEHVTKAIALHETGSVNESSYHLRLAARQGHPTGMLLFALACRHGWGMRPNAREGVQWLRKAAESASIEMAEVEDKEKQGKHADFLEKKTRKAQFALSIYELGVSHMNGWGIEQDKALALRCFEIAGSWGDVDALAEAGFCYAQGVGCKKNLKKSAFFYRQAEEKGMSMVGNSWIHKAKYDDEDTQSLKSKTRSKSRTRKGFFGKKS